MALSTNGGQTWHDVAFPVARLFKATHLPNAGGYIVVANVSCPTVQRCLVAQADDAFPLQATELPIARTSDGGKTWQILPAPLGPGGNNLGAGLGELACMTASRCVLADGRAVVLTGNAGTSWHALTLIRPPPTAAKESSGADCSDALRCAAYFSWESSAQIGSSLSFRITYKTLLLTTANGGRTWRRVLLPSAFGVGSALWCGSSGHCALSAATDPSRPGRSGANYLATSADNGRDWAESSQTIRFSCATSHASLVPTAGFWVRRQQVRPSRESGWRPVVDGEPARPLLDVLVRRPKVLRHLGIRRWLGRNSTSFPGNDDERRCLLAPLLVPDQPSFRTSVTDRVWVSHRTVLPPAGRSFSPRRPCVPGNRPLWVA